MRVEQLTSTEISITMGVKRIQTIGTALVCVFLRETPSLQIVILIVINTTMLPVIGEHPIYGKLSIVFKVISFQIH